MIKNYLIHWLLKSISLFFDVNNQWVRLSVKQKRGSYLCDFCSFKHFKLLEIPIGMTHIHVCLQVFPPLLL